MYKEIIETGREKEGYRVNKKEKNSIEGDG